MQSEVQNRLELEGVANQAYRQAFNRKVFTFAHVDDWVVGVFWQQFYAVGGFTQPFDRDFIAQSGDNDLSVAGFVGGLHG